MSASQEIITTSQAAEILGVHESSIKRWCAARKLTFSKTGGGHRRISLRALLAFAEQESIKTPLTCFQSYAERVWCNIDHLRRKEEFEPLVHLGFEWMVEERPSMLLHLLWLLQDLGYRSTELLDAFISPVMHRVGRAYLESILSIGDEHRITHSMRDVLIRHQGRTASSAHELSPDRPVAIAGCPRNQEHELGALMARMVLEESGWQVIYLGLNVPTEEFARQQIAHRASLVCIALMPPVGETEALHIEDLLRQMYDSNQPYRLVFGGPLQGHPSFAPPGFPKSYFFSSLSSFKTWLEEADG